MDNRDKTPETLVSDKSKVCNDQAFQNARITAISSPDFWGVWSKTHCRDNAIREVKENENSFLY